MSLPPTAPQIDYIRALQQKLRLPDRILDTHCVRSYGLRFAEMSRADMSRLIDELKGWQAIPAELQRARGQRALPGMEGLR